MLRSAALRFAVNEAYERGPDWLRTAIDRTFTSPVIPVPIRWRCTFAGQTFWMPILPDVRRSWNAALVWRWTGNRSIRALYERYLSFRPRGTFIDVGANDGTHTYPFALHGYSCLAIEPQRTCVEYIRRVCELNGFAHVEILEALVSDEQSAEAEMFVSDSTWVSSRLREHTERFEPARPVTVRAVWLDAVCQDRSMQPSLIKIDVEGWEWHALNSAAGVLRGARPDLFVEILYENPNKRAIWDLTAELGYQCVHVAHYTRHPFRRVTTADEFMAGPGPYSDDYFFSRDRTLVEQMFR